MEINHTTGHVTNTDQLSDVDSMILEKAEELRKLCLDSKKQCNLMVDIGPSFDKPKPYSFWSIPCGNKDMEVTTDKSDCYGRFYYLTDYHLRSISGNIFRVEKMLPE